MRSPRTRPSSPHFATRFARCVPALVCAFAFASSGDDEPLVRPAIVRFSVDPARGEVGFDGTSTLHDFTGRTREVSGTVLVDPTHPTRFLSGQVECLAASLDTDNDSRDEKLREHLDVEHHPAIEFMVARAAGERRLIREVDVVGTFRIHGVQREYRVVTSTESLTDGALHVRGRVPLSLTDHGIVSPKVVLIEVADRVQAWFDLVLVPIHEEEVEARSYAAVVDEAVAPIGGAAASVRRHETFFLTADLAFWERVERGEWIRGSATIAPRTISLATGAEVPRVQSAEESFAEARETMARLREKLAKLEGPKREKAERAVSETLSRLTAVLVEAPAETELVRRTLADGEQWLLGDRVWLELHGRRGEGAIAPLLASLEGLPIAVREALVAVEGVPARVVVRTATMGGIRTLTLDLAEARPARIPRSLAVGELR